MCDEVSENISPVFFGATLLTPSKKDGGLRPIALGETLQRLTAKCALDVIHSPILHLVGRFQYGIGTQNGADVIIHSAFEYLSAMSHNV